ncbi:Transcriptional regulator [[Actinomadura] parvosata subsp. kistnae]|uniref:Bacterial transcriptional activator domain-containing protein n=1 Tax=[Actinomadura] parvosata subsp. kistnae TaxID=1909395 RepID=A0A1V0A4X6_9ACTN|nr:BTAD domain-containing putative transcriptional regulator [Nonomuraea sp. ATCC 55076]AQZ65251.1 hypothetical protein BKM31_30795 [Nonomuraea sp. ATCC 55076]SPL96555.1 Transcriptional regulator [Actinomadura parvosata subsp. kistnae]
MLLAKVAAPMPELRWPAQFSLDGLGDRARLHLLVPEGYLVEGQLAADLLRAGRGLGWLRPDPYELEPDDLRRLAAASEPAGTVVIQQPLADPTRLGGPAPALAASEVVLSPCAGDRGLAVRAESAVAAAGHLDCPLRRDVIDRLVAVTGGRSAVIDSVLRAACLRGAARQDVLAERVMRAGGLAELVASVVAWLLRDAEPARLQALALAARLGYAHEDLTALRPALREPGKEPWWEPLTGGWYRMLPFWSTAICALRPARTPAFRRRLALLAGELVGAHAAREAVELSRRANDRALLSDLLSETDVTLTPPGPEVMSAEPEVMSAGPDGPPAGAGGMPAGLEAAWRRARAALVVGRLGEALEHGRRARDLTTEPEPADRIRHALRLIRRTMRARSAHKRMMLLLQAMEATTWPHATASATSTTAPPHATTWPRTAASGTGATAPAHATTWPHATASGMGATAPAHVTASPHATIPPNGAAPTPPTPAAPPDHVATRQATTPGAAAAHTRPERATTSGPEGEVHNVAGAAAGFGREGGRADVEAWLLGTFRLRVGGRPVEEWSGKLGRSVLMYLLLSHPKPIRRDVVIDAIWPGVPEGAARNRLNATMHALRADLRKAAHPDRQVIVYERETYALAPGLSIWLDVEEFAGRCATAALLQEEDGKRGEAIARHEAARALYAGDLLEDAPYLDWVVPERERLSTAYVDLLDGLAALYLAEGAYAKCVDTCRRVLARDSCREQTHRLLMRCHARQNQPHKALAQYETCRRELDAVLGMTPSPETHALFESVRRHLTV